MAAMIATGISTATRDLSELVAGTQTTLMRPASFFVSWQGVMTLAYRGFPGSIISLKTQLDEFFPTLPKENSGSKWPKTTIGCLKEKKRLTPEQLATLIKICEEESGIFQNPNAPKHQTVLVDSLSVVYYNTRSLESRVLTTNINLLPSVDSADPAPTEKARTDAVLAECHEPDYWFAASKDGNRENHYRSVAPGLTLVHDLKVLKPGFADHAEFGAKLPEIVKSFRERVDKELPGMYSWFSDDSLHITVRALIC